MDDAIACLLGFVAALGVAFAVLTGQKNVGVEAEALESSGYFVTISDEEFGDIVYDSREGVEYWRSDSAYNRGTLTMLYDADGKPLIYGESKRYEYY